ncbi:FAD-binding domain-containing protein [Cadophora sp. DSE1049]|nr:FAD-binding domain-containing protein [Cadophora sp. DSE1049]
MVAIRSVSVLAALAAALLVQGLSPSFEHVVDRGSNIFSELDAQLSPNASIILPADPLFQTAGARWQAYSRPTYSAVVEVAVEEDVQKTVRFANKYSIPFLAVDGAHGFISTLGRMQNGIAISFSKMKGITVSRNGKFADLNPGLTNGDIVRTLWAQNKYTVTGNCMCTGIMGIMLGGGHGYLQGLYGLAADQILEARVVLADGSCVTASPESNPDLFWALRGAGHNFGIVTGLKYKVYESLSLWTEIQMIFKGDKVEEFFEVANNLTQEENHPAKLIHWSNHIRRPDIDPDNAILNTYFIYQGTPTELEKYVAPFRALGPVGETRTTAISYPDLFPLNRANETNLETCGKGLYRHLFPVGLKRYNPAAQRKIYNLFNNLTATYPSIAFTSTFVMEGYSTQAVTSVPDESTAFPFREDNILQSPVWGYTDPSLSAEIIAVSKEMRRILVDASGSNKLHAYVNYAFGDETLPEMYGHEPWRVKKLKQLKKKYDPNGRFNFYAPII